MTQEEAVEVFLRGAYDHCTACSQGVLSKQLEPGGKRVFIDICPTCFGTSHVLRPAYEEALEVLKLGSICQPVSEEFMKLNPDYFSRIKHVTIDYKLTL